ncbi:MAG: hypothetical protein RL094_500 [Candidatus Parcubacteria bacterium]|jgi:ABC-type multidrug transport system fused ATPase/permease subunit
MNKLRATLRRFFGVGIIAFKETQPLAPVLTWLIAAGMMIGTVVSFVTAKLTAVMGDKIQLGAQTHNSDIVLKTLWAYGFYLVLASTVRIAVVGLKTCWQWRVRTAMQDRVRAQRLKLDIATLESPEFGKIERSIQESQYSWNVAVDITLHQFEGLTHIIGIISALVIVCSYSVTLALMLILFIIPEFIADLYIGKVQWKVGEERAERAKWRNNASRCFLHPAALIETKLFHSAKFLIGIISTFNKGLIDDVTKIEKRRFALAALSEIISMIGLVYCMYYVVSAALKGEILVGTMGLLFMGLNSLRSYSNSLLNILNDQFTMARYLDNVQQFFALKPRLIVAEEPISLQLHEPPTIEFKDVSFKYPSQEEGKFALRNVNLTIRPGDKIGVFGKNGSGKSTLVSLLCRIHDPTEGVILLNGVDLKLIDPSEWQLSLAVLLQRHYPYRFTLREIIGLGDIRKTPRDEEIHEALQYANADKVVEKMRDGLDTQLGEELGGVDLSGGEWKRLAIASRMFARRHTLIFDEPEKELDAESRSKFFAQLRDLPPAVTALFISHNMATLRLAKRIIAFEDGQVVGDGTHDQLVEAGGTYAKAFEGEMEALMQKVSHLRPVDPAANAA